VGGWARKALDALEGRVGSYQVRRAFERRLMDFDRRREQIGIVEQLVIDREVDHDLVLGLLHFTILPNSLGLPPCLCRMISVDGSNTLRSLPFRARTAPIDRKRCFVPLVKCELTAKTRAVIYSSVRI
jgi:hypothetical protein